MPLGFVDQFYYSDQDSQKRETANRFPASYNELK